MAQRYGGRYSPDGRVTGPGEHAPAPPPPPSRPRDAAPSAGGGFRVWLLFALPFLFVWKAFRGDPATLVLSLSVFVLLMLGAWLTREGVRAQAAYDARKVARRPAFPRKMAGAGLTGAGLATGTVLAGHAPLVAALIGAIGAALHLAAFGPDPLRDKGAEGIDPFQADRVAGAVAEAERHLAAMQDAILRAGDRRLEAKVAGFAATARRFFRAVEGDPRDLTAARRYLGVYLQGGRDATAKFADLYARSRDDRARADWESLIDEMDRAYAEAIARLEANDHEALNVEVEVLRERLAREGG